MKEIIDSYTSERTAEQESFGNRKLIRPSLNRADHNHNYPQASLDRRDRPNHLERPDRSDRDRGERPMGGKKFPPPEQTNAENFYYQKQMQSKTPMVVVLHDGEEIHGTIEWYDRNCIKVNRSGGEPNLMIYKPAIKYMFKEGENGKG